MNKINMKQPKTPKIKYKLSYYNHLLTYSDGTRLAYNALTSKIINLNDPNNQNIEGILRGNLDPLYTNPTLTLRLSKEGYIVDKDINELNVIKEIYNNYRLTNKDQISLTILPTLGCNFDCPYCFERHTKGLMSKEVQEALVEFFKTRLASTGKKVHIEWFGGEPLLGISVIKYLTERFRQVCKEVGFDMPSAAITTNGYYLTYEMMIELMSLGVESAQVTIDGTPEIHNKRRFLLNGKGTFDKILDNLKNIPPGFEIQIRINVDSFNKENVFDLLTLLKNNNITPKAKPYVAMVEPFIDEGRPFVNGVLSSKEFVDFKQNLIERCRKSDIPLVIENPPSLKACGFCMVDSLNSFVIEPNGTLLKCWSEAGNIERTSVGNLLNKKTLDNIQISSLQTRNPFDDIECCECKILPICMGGCPKLRDNNKKTHLKECPPLRYSFSDEIYAMYRGHSISTGLV